MTITYTFGDVGVPALNGKTFTGGTFCRIDGKPGTPDAVLFVERVDGRPVKARSLNSFFIRSSH